MAQNLVPNGSFEDFSSCPIENELNNGEFEKAKGWWTAFGTPDYYNACNNSVVDVPKNFWGYQPAFDGNAYIGLVIGLFDSNSYEGEYPQTKLLSELKPCYEYKFSMYVSLSDYSTHGVGRLGIYLSSDSTNSFESNLQTFPAQYYNQTIIPDTSAWTKIEGNFIASGGEKYLMLGYFFDNVTDDTAFVQSSPFWPGALNYYIDSVSLLEIGLPEENSCVNYSIPNVFTPNDDAVNDIIDISVYSGFEPEMQIFNRWGEIVTILNTQNLIWDGTSNGKACTDGVYFYKLIYHTPSGEKLKNGLIHLIRE